MFDHDRQISDVVEKARFLLKCGQSVLKQTAEVTSSFCRSADGVECGVAIDDLCERIFCFITGVTAVSWSVITDHLASVRG